MAATEVSPLDTGAFGRMQAILSRNLDLGGPRYSIHPGDLAWWVYHSDPRRDADTSYWLDEESGFVVLGGHGKEVVAFAVHGHSPLELITWGMQRVGTGAHAGLISNLDHELESELATEGMTPAKDGEPLFVRGLEGLIPEPDLAPGWSLRPVLGEEEADNRRTASHAAFESTMEPGAHLERYLRFMRSMVYEPERDLVAVAPDGTIASFMVWWADRSGIAQIEPFGTDPRYQGQGLGRALMSFALRRMQDAGMRQARVMTDAHRLDAIAFYRAMGFQQVAELRTWQRP